MSKSVNLSREHIILKTSIIGIGTNVLLGIVKALVGVLAGSIALAADALNNLSDAVSSVITIVGTKLAGKAPSKEHPFGYGRIEYMTALVIGFIVLGAGLGAAKSAIDGILEPQATDYSVAFIGVVIVTMVAKVLLGNYTIKIGESVNSGALKAAGIDAKNDALVSAMTLVAAIVYFVFDINIDAYAGVLISLAVIKAGFDILKETVGTLLGERVDSELSQAVYDLIRNYPGVKEAHDLILSNYGPDRYLGSVHIEVDGKKTFSDLYPMIYRLERDIYHTFNAIVTVGYYAVDESSPETQAVKKILQNHQDASPYIVGYHGICVFPDKKEIFFDITFAFGAPVNTLLEAIKHDIKTLYPDYEVMGQADFDVADGEY